MKNKENKNRPQPLSHMQSPWGPLRPGDPIWL